MTTAGGGARAWGGDPERKRHALQAVATAIRTWPQACHYPYLKLAGADNPRAMSNVYCAAFGTADPGELEARSGVPTDVLRLICAVLTACDAWRPAPEGGGKVHVAPAAVDGALRALEAIPVGTDLGAVLQRYLLALYDDLQSGALIDGRALGTSVQQALSRVAVLHRSGSGDAAAFRAARRAAMQATDAATSDIDRTVLEFVEAVAWPAEGLGAELPNHIVALHVGLRDQLGSQRPTVEERRILDVWGATFASLIEEYKKDPSRDWEWVEQRAREVPEVVVVQSSEFQARLAGYACAACDEYAPRAVGGLLKVLRPA